MRLYKYLHPDRVDVLRNAAIRFSSPSVLNDPFELKPHLSGLASDDDIHSGFEGKLSKILADEYVKLPADVRQRISFRELKNLAKAQMPQMKEGLQELVKMAVPVTQRIMHQKFEELIGILCLSESLGNLLMWAHYANSHQGFVIEFDADSPFFEQRVSPDDELRHLRKVVYQEQRPSIILSEVEEFSAFLTKSVDWSYEAEWRMMMPLDAATVVIGEGHSAVHLFEFPRSAIRSVILGCRVSEEKEGEIRGILRDIEGLRHVSCLRAEVDETHYRLMFSEL